MKRKFSPVTVKLLIQNQDLDLSGSVTLTMYNPIKEGIRVATNIILKGYSVRIECINGNEAQKVVMSVSSLEELSLWKDKINAIVLHPGKHLD